MRKRYIGDYDHAVLATRASGTGNSARSLVYADGILLSNLLGNGAGFTPRWGLVTPEEIERVDVLYGPFSAAYSGNSAGAIVDYVTRMPTRLEAHAKLQGFAQPYQLYGTDERFSGGAGERLDRQPRRRVLVVDRAQPADSDAQPMSFVVKNVAGDDERGGNAGDRRGRRPQPEGGRRATCSARRRRRTRCRTTPSSSSPTTSRRRCARRTRSAGGATTPTAASTRSCATPAGNA